MATFDDFRAKYVKNQVPFSLNSRQNFWKLPRSHRTGCSRRAVFPAAAAATTTTTTITTAAAAAATVGAGAKTTTTAEVEGRQCQVSKNKTLKIDPVIDTNDNYKTTFPLTEVSYSRV